jgi:hypothetical protein
VGVERRVEGRVVEGWDGFFGGIDALGLVADGRHPYIDPQDRWAYRCECTFIYSVSIATAYIYSYTNCILLPVSFGIDFI